MNSKLTIQFNSPEALNAAMTYLVNQTAPFRNSSVTPTVGLDVNTNEAYANTEQGPSQVTFPSETWANRAFEEITAKFNRPNNSTHDQPYIASRITNA